MKEQSKRSSRTPSKPLVACAGSLSALEPRVYLNRICLMNSRAVFVELKAPGKQPRPIQQHRMNQLRDQGFQTFVVDSMDGIQEVLDALSAA